MAKKWQIDEGIKIFGCQNLKNSSLYNGEEEFIRIMAQNLKNSALYNFEGNFKNIWLKSKKNPLYIVVEG